MKKAIIILMAAAIAATAGTAAACSKGQTGGGNNTLSGYTRTVEEGTDGNAANADEGRMMPCPDCGHGDEHGRGDDRHMLPPDGGAWARRKKPAPTPPSPPAEENGQTAPEESGAPSDQDNRSRSSDEQGREHGRPDTGDGNAKRPIPRTGNKPEKHN